jgi:hypothetical protein
MHGAAPFRGSTAIDAGMATPAMLRGRDWRRLLRDVYIGHDAPVDHGVWCAAVALVLPPGAAIGGLSAAYLHGAPLVRPDSPVSVVLPRGQQIRRREQRIVVHYTVLEATDLTSLGPADPPALRAAGQPAPGTADPAALTAAGLPLTTPERTAFDLGRRLRRADALVAVDALLRTGSLDLGKVAGLARERRHWPLISQLNEILRLADARAESPMETRMRLLFHDAGLPAGEPQVEVREQDGHLIGRVDLGWRTRRLAVEYEGDHHRERDQFRRDIARVNALRAAGWRVLRFAADDILRRPRQTAALVAAELSRPS